jgi:hypothetical protein
MSKAATSQSTGLASSKDVKSIFGPLDKGALLEIMAFHPTIRDLEEAATWLAGDRDIFGAGGPLRDVVAEIVAILTSNEEDEEQRSR